MATNEEETLSEQDLSHLTADPSLWMDYKRSDDKQARDELIKKHLKLVKYVAGQLAVGMPPEVQPEDLETYGIFGLVDALKRFDMTRGIKFETYAVTRVRGSILDGVRKMDWVPASVRRKTRKIEEAYQALREKLGRQATDQEMAEYLDVSLGRFKGDVEQMSRSSLVYLDEVRSDEDGGGVTSLLSFIPDDNATDPFEAVSWKRQKELLAEAIKDLKERERLILTLYYYEGLTLAEIGEVLDLSASRISQIHSKTVLKLRGMLGANENLFEENS